MINTTFNAFKTTIVVLTAMATLFATVLPGAADDDDDDRAPVLMIDNILPAAEDLDVDLFGPLPSVAPPRLTELFDWSGESPVALELDFRMAEQNLNKIDAVEVFVNGLPVVDFELTAVGSGGGEGRGPRELPLNTLHKVTRFKLQFVLPYELPADELKTHLEVVVQVAFKKHPTIEARQFATLLNNPALDSKLALLLETVDDLQSQIDQTNADAAGHNQQDDAKFAAILAAMGGAECSVDGSFPGAEEFNFACSQFASNFLEVCAASPILRDALGIVNTSVVAVLNAGNSTIGALNSVFSGFNSTWNALENFSLNINPPSFSINPPSFGVGDICPGPLNCSFSINPPSFGINPPSFDAGKPFKFLPEDPLSSIPEISSSIIGSVDAALGQIQGCALP